MPLPMPRWNMGCRSRFDPGLQWSGVRAALCCAFSYRKNGTACMSVPESSYRSLTDASCRQARRHFFTEQVGRTHFQVLQCVVEAPQKRHRQAG
jgi:hypothetical protein